jgi:hypothetical protein
MNQETIQYWDSGEGYYWTEKNPKSENERGFWTSFGNVHPSTVDKYEKWTTQQKEEWEQAHADDTGEVYE